MADARAHAAKPLLAAFRFVVHVDEARPGRDTSFLEVSGLSGERETETVHEGGENRYALSLPGHARPGRLVLRRGMSEGPSDLLDWCQAVIDGGLSRPIERRAVRVWLLDAAGQPLRGWMAENAWPVACQATPLSAMRNAYAIESIELACTQVLRLAGA